jgi:hypothetical protein
MVTVDTDRTQSIIGFIKANPANPKELKNLSIDLSNDFASVVLSSMDGKPIAQSDKMLLTTGSRVSNTGLKWNDTRTRSTGGESPSLIEPVTGTVLLRGLAAAKSINASALDGSGHPIGAPIAAAKNAKGWTLPVGTPVTTWFLISVKR